MGLRKVVKIRWQEVVNERIDMLDDEEIVEVDAIESHGVLALHGVWIMRVIHRYDDTGVPPPEGYAPPAAEGIVPP